jgi:hypothetical protein
MVSADDLGSDGEWFGGVQVRGEQINQAAGATLVQDGKTGVGLQCNTMAPASLDCRTRFIVPVRTWARLADPIGSRAIRLKPV